MPKVEQRMRRAEPTGLVVLLVTLAGCIALGWIAGPAAVAALPAVLAAAAFLVYRSSESPAPGTSHPPAEPDATRDGEGERR